MKFWVLFVLTSSLFASEFEDTFKQGRSAYLKKQFDESVQYFTKAEAQILESRQLQRFISLYVNALIKSKQYNEIENFHQRQYKGKFSKKNIDFSLDCFLLKAKYLLKKHDEIEPIYQRIMAEKSNYINKKHKAMAILYYAHSAYENERYEVAKENYFRITDHNTLDEPLTLYLNLISSCFETEQAADAAHALTQALDQKVMNHENLDMIFELIAKIREAKEFEPAIKLSKRILRDYAISSKERTACYKEIAMNYKQQNDYIRFLRIMEISLIDNKLTPDDKEIIVALLPQKKLSLQNQ